LAVGSYSGDVVVGLAGDRDDVCPDFAESGGDELVYRVIVEDLIGETIECLAEGGGGCVHDAEVKEGVGRAFRPRAATSEGMNAAELQAGVDQHQWFHQIDLGHGIVTPGPDNSKAKLDDVAFPVDLTGKSVLDVGTFNGFFAFEAEKRGAARVVAVDEFIWERGPWSKAAFDFAHRALDSKVEPLLMSIEKMTPEELGTFDVVIFMGILYHAPDPLGYLHKCRAMCSHDGMALVETHSDANDQDRPMVVFYPGMSLNQDPTNYWGPNRLAVDAMLTESGFGSLYHPPLASTGRYTVHAHVPDGRGNPMPAETPGAPTPDRVGEKAEEIVDRAAALAKAGFSRAMGLARRLGQ
jgi:tRNA (mo5U34)-methyltransferase